MSITLSSWNINGIRAVSAKEGFDWFRNTDYDVIGFQETKASAEQLSDELKNKPGYESFFCSSTVKKGYSGTAVFTRLKPLSVEFELPDEEFKGEGRIIHLEFEKFHFFNGYFPNGGAAILDENGKPTGEFKRVPYKMGFFDSFFKYAQELRKDKPIVVCGDFNIAHREIDLARPKTNISNTGFLPIERAFLDKMVDADTLTHSDSYMAMNLICTAGGHTRLLQDKRTSDGELTISLYPMSLKVKFLMQRLKQTS